MDGPGSGSGGRSDPSSPGSRADSPEDVTRFEPVGDALTIAASSDHALTIAAVSDSLADAMTIADPVTPAVHTRGQSPASKTGPLEVGQSFGPRYHIIRLLGAGGMGAVYQAWDAELEVAVAIKVIRPDVMADPTVGAEVSRRFKRELLLARQVTHKNVVRIHDLGDIEGIKYITMSYVEGTDLATILKRDGKRPVRDLLPIARGVINGLVAAHGAGVVHRDLKPANIMIGKDGEALIMDFGIAYSTGDAAAAPAPGAGVLPEHLRRAASHHAATTVGSIVGTLEYMAPEQAKGMPIDQRADVYAFGLILYDALLGQRRAASGSSAIDELQRRMAAPPPPLQALAPDLPAPLATLIARCVEPEADKRFQTSAEVAGEFDRLDEDGKQIRVARHLTGRLVAVAALVVATLVATAIYVTQQTVAPIEAHEPVVVVIADIENRTGNAEFNRALEPTFRRALEGTTFITAYDRTRIRPQFGVTPPETFDARGARELAVKQGLGVVLAGSIAPARGGYEIEMSATEAVTEKVIGTADGHARSKEQVLEVAARVADEVRKLLGDKTSESAQLFASRTMSTTSLDAVRHHARAAEALSNGKFEEARQGYLEAVKLDPNFGLAYQGLAVASRNLDQLEDADRYIKEALRLIDGMTERESFGTRGFYYRSNGDYQRCVEQYGQLTAKFAADVGGHNQRALCLSKLRQLTPAVEEMRSVVKILPKRVLYRVNLALYAAYAGEFAAAEQEARLVQEPDPYIRLALAFSQLGQGQLREAETTYRNMSGISSQAASIATSGFGDLALYEGRFGDAIRILSDGVQADVTAKNSERAARKLISIAYAQLALGHNPLAIAAAQRALTLTDSVEARFLAGRILAQAGAASADDIAQKLASETAPEPKAYGKIVLGEIALKRRDAGAAVKQLTEANALLDTWLGHEALGRAYLELGRAVDADAEFGLCIKRRGEALSVLLDEEQTYGYFPSALYHRGQARERLGTAGFRDSYRQYLAIRGNSPDDPLLKDVRRRAQ